MESCPKTTLRAEQSRASDEFRDKNLTFHHQPPANPRRNFALPRRRVVSEDEDQRHFHTHPQTFPTSKTGGTQLPEASETVFHAITALMGRVQWDTSIYRDHEIPQRMHTNFPWVSQRYHLLLLEYSPH